MTEYEAVLQTAGVGPIDSELELDWSGRGQHAQFSRHEVNIINELLPIQDTLGKGNSAVVHSVKCRRILLARKTIYTNRHFTKRQAVLEVAHLTRFHHAHVVRLIGTYTWQKELSILMYPATEHNLTSFLESLTHETQPHYEPRFTSRVSQGLILSCRNFFPCLSSALHHIHQNLTKHMDIKPQNILVRLQAASSCVGGGSAYTAFTAKAYISDFGIARSYQTPEAANTDGATSFTRRYAAPEVVQQDFRGLPADIFSMGCVFTEIFSTLHELGRTDDESWEGYIYKPSMMKEELSHLLAQGMDPSYQNHIESIHKMFESPTHQLCHDSTINAALSAIILRMLSRDPADRPTASELTQLLPPLPCCSLGPDELERVKDDDEGRTAFGDVEGSATGSQELMDHAVIQDLIKGTCVNCRTAEPAFCQACLERKSHCNNCVSSPLFSAEVCLCTSDFSILVR